MTCNAPADDLHSTCWWPALCFLMICALFADELPCACRTLTCRSKGIWQLSTRGLYVVMDAHLRQLLYGLRPCRMRHTCFELYMIKLHFSVRFLLIYWQPLREIFDVRTGGSFKGQSNYRLSLWARMAHIWVHFVLFCCAFTCKLVALTETNYCNHTNTRAESILYILLQEQLGRHLCIMELWYVFFSIRRAARCILILHIPLVRKYRANTPRKCRDCIYASVSHGLWQFIRYTYTGRQSPSMWYTSIKESLRYTNGAAIWSWLKLGCQWQSPINPFASFRKN